MTTIAKQTIIGIQRTEPSGWIAVKVTMSMDDSGTEWAESSRRLIAGPFFGLGSKRTAIAQAGTNREVPAERMRVPTLDAGGVQVTA